LFARRPGVCAERTAGAVSPLFRDYRFRKRSAAFSIIAHCLLVAAILWLPGWLALSEKRKRARSSYQLTTQPFVPESASQAQENRWWGRRWTAREDPCLARQTAALLRSSVNAADAEIVNLKPVLPVEPTVVVPQLAQLPPVNIAQLGDPLGIPGPLPAVPNGWWDWNRHRRWCRTGQGSRVGPGEGGGTGLDPSGLVAV